MSEREISDKPDAYEARVVRDALAALGMFMAPMLPGEEHHDGRPVEDHFLLYLALLKCRIDATVEMNVKDTETRKKFEALMAAAREAEGKTG
jgi:hypothetical protein